LSGGVFGPEDSIVTIFIVIVCLAVQMRMLRNSKREKRLGDINSRV